MLCLKSWSKLENKVVQCVGTSEVLHWAITTIQSGSVTVPLLCDKSIIRLVLYYAAGIQIIVRHRNTGFYRVLQNIVT